MPRHSKHKKAKRPWYDQPVEGKERSRLSKIFKLALFHDWELRPQALGIWVIARGKHRLFVTYDEKGNEFQDCILVVNGLEDQERKLTEQQMLKFIKRYGRLYEPSD